jgi:hypothetical protein
VTIAAIPAGRRVDAEATAAFLGGILSLTWS